MLRPLAGQRADAVRGSLPAEARDEALEVARAVLWRQQVDLVQHQPTRLTGQALGVTAELLLDRAELGDGPLFVLEARGDDVQQQTRTLQVLQETSPEAGPLRRSGDEARNVRQHEA